MSTVVLDNCICEPRGETREQWLAQRVRGLGGSDAAKIVGASDWGGPVDIYLEKTGRRAIDHVEETKKMKWGNRLEAPILQAYKEEFCEPLGKDIIVPSVMYRSKEYPWMFANPDSLVVVTDGPYLDRGVDAKNSSAYDKWGPSGSEQYPLDYYFQCLHYMIVLGVPHWDLAVLMGGWDFRTYTINFNEDDAAKLVEVEEAFWKQNVLADVSPPIEDTNPRALDLIAEVYSGFDPRPVMLPDLMVADIEEYYRLGDVCKELTQQRDHVKAKMLLAMGNHGHALISGTGYEFTRKQRNDAIQAHTRSFIDFRIKKPKKGK